MILPVNKEIKNYKQKVFFGLTVRRFIFLVLALMVGVITYFSIRNFVPFDVQTWIIGGAVIPVALLGFLEPYGMPLEKFLKIIIRNKFLVSKHLVFKSQTLYMEIENEYLKIQKTKNKKQNKSNEPEGDMNEKEKMTFTFFLKKYKYVFIIALAVVALIAVNKAGLFRIGNDKEAALTEETHNEEPYYEADGNNPTLLKTMNYAKDFVSINPLDEKGRATGAMAYIGLENIKQDQKNIKVEVIPSGFSKTYYYELVGKDSDGSLFVVGNLIPFVGLKPENAVTETKFMNDNMKPFIDQIQQALNKKLHVVISAIPKFNGDDVLCESVQFQAYSVEDKGASVSFNMVFKNVQPGVEINYSTGESAKE